MGILEITVATGEPGPVVRLSGECDVSVAGQLGDAVDSLIADGVKRLCVDVSELAFADSACIGVFVRAHRVLKERGGALELAFPQPAVARALSLLGVDQVLTVRVRSAAPAAGPEEGALLRMIPGTRDGRCPDAGVAARVQGARDTAMGAGMALDQAFDTDTLADLRKAVLAVVAAAGMPDRRAAEVVLAVHELAANAVRHGGGAGRALLRIAGGELHCQVSDTGPGSPGGDDRRAGTGGAPSWPVRRGHGLWLVRNAADRFSIVSGPGGSAVTAVFALPGSRDGTAGA